MSDRGALESARAEIRSIAVAFRRAAVPAVEATLRARLEALTVARRRWFDGLSEEQRAGLRSAADGAIAAAAVEVDRRLADADLWLDPLTAPGVPTRPEAAWEADLPEWLVGLARRLFPRERHGALGDLDDPANRAWVAILAAAEPLDPVLEEFGLPPAEIPDLGGGNYGLAPRSLSGLDPSGTLARIWKRYRRAYERYAALRDGA